MKVPSEIGSLCIRENIIDDIIPKKDNLIKIMLKFVLLKIQ